MDKLNRMTADDRANLVAYLDGETDEEQTRRIESILASNAVARADVESLARTYELLDDLPRPEVGAEFTEQTVATARIEEFHIPLSQRPWFRHAQQLGLLAMWSALMLGSAALGFGASYLWLPQEADLLLDDYPVIQRLDEYREVGEIEFLDSLQADEELMNQLKQETARELR